MVWHSMAYFFSGQWRSRYAWETSSVSSQPRLSSESHIVGVHDIVRSCSAARIVDRDRATRGRKLERVRRELAARPEEAL
jgi:hypothetical protein